MLGDISYTKLLKKSKGKQQQTTKVSTSVPKDKAPRFIYELTFHS